MDPAKFDAAAYQAELLAQGRVAESAVMATVFSPDGRFVVAGSNLGRLCVWDCARTASAGFWEEGEGAAPDLGPQLSLELGAGAVYALQFVEAAGGPLLVVGMDASARLLRWAAVEAAVAEGAAELPADAVAADLPCAQLRGGNGCLSPLCEVNGVAVNAARGELYLASGDGAAYVWDLGSFQQSATLQASAGMLHGVWALPGAGALLTACEDGAVRIWDVRAGACADSVAGAAAGGYATCVSADASETWIAAGGGAPPASRRAMVDGGWLSTWHLGSRQLICGMDCGAVTQALLFGDDGELLSVGNERHLRRWRRRTGELVSQVPSSSAALCALAVAPATQALALSGYSPSVDVLINSGNRAFSLEFR